MQLDIRGFFSVAEDEFEVRIVKSRKLKVKNKS